MSWITKILLGVDTTQFRKGLANADAALKKFSGQLQNLGGLIGATFIGSKIASFTKQAIELGSQMKQVGAGFSRMADDSNLQGLRASTRGLVNDLELMKVAVQAGNFGIPLQEMGTLLDFAARRAAETGQEVDYLVNSIVTGIGRKSPMILDNLGISTTRLKEQFHGASVEAQSIADVAAAVGKIAEEELGKMGPPVQTAADQMARLGVHLDNFLAKVSKPIEIVFEFVFGGAADFLDVRTSGNVSPAERFAYLASYFDPTGMAGIGSRAGIYGKAMGQFQSPGTSTVPTQGAFPYQAQEMGTGIFAQFPSFDTATINGLREYATHLQNLMNAARMGTPEFAKLKAQLDGVNQQIKDALDGVVPHTDAIKLQTKGVNDLNVAMTQHGEVMRVIPMVGNEYEKYISDIIDSYTQMELQLNAMTVMAQEFGNVFTAAFDASIMKGEDFFKVLRDALVNYVKQMAVATAATFAFAIAWAFVTGGSNFAKAFNVMGSMNGLPFEMGQGGKFQLRGSDLILATGREQQQLFRTGYKK